MGSKFNFGRSPERVPLMIVDPSPHVPHLSLHCQKQKMKDKAHSHSPSLEGVGCDKYIQICSPYLRWKVSRYRKASWFFLALEVKSQKWIFLWNPYTPAKWHPWCVFSQGWSYLVDLGGNVSYWSCKVVVVRRAVFIWFQSTLGTNKLCRGGTPHHELVSCISNTIEV